MDRRAVLGARAHSRNHERSDLPWLSRPRTDHNLVRRLQRQCEVPACAGKMRIPASPNHPAGFPDSFTQRIIAHQPVPFQGALYSPEHSQRFKTEHSEAKLERDPENEHRFILKIDGVSVFQWFRDMDRKLFEKIGFRPPEPSQRNGIPSMIGISKC